MDHGYRLGPCVNTRPVHWTRRLFLTPKLQTSDSTLERRAHTRGGKASELASRVRNRDRLRLAARRTAARPSILVIADSSRPTTHRVSRRLAPCDSRDAAVSTISISRPPNDSTNTHEAPGGKRRARRQCGPFTLPTRAPALVPRRAHLGALDLVEAISTVEPLNRVKISSSSKRATQ